MNLFIISWKYLIAKPLNTVLNVLILSLGIAMITLLLLVNHQIEQKLFANAKGIDLVVGAKGSPLQLILSSIFHIDNPTGNIPLSEATRLIKNPMVKYAIPLALGDSYNTFRIVGSNHQYVDLYKAELAEGKLWELPMEVTIGAEVSSRLKLKTGDSFYGAHGLGEATSHVHEERAYKVVGILAKSNTVLDNLILTKVESVWLAHENPNEEENSDHDDKSHNEGTNHEDEHEQQVEDNATDSEKITSEQVQNQRLNAVQQNKETGLPEGDEDKELTSLLVKFKSPMGAITFPRFINENTSMQAASPPYEVARLFTLLGVGIDMIQGFAFLMVFIAILSIFIALYNALKERKYDLAIMRSLGSSKFSLLVLVIVEGALITTISATLGVILGHGVIESIGAFFKESDKVGLTGMIFLPQETLMLLFALLIGIITALIPAIQAYKTDISKVLSKG